MSINQQSEGFVMSDGINNAATPITVAVIFHSGFGHTARQAEAVRRGIERVAGASTLYLTSCRLREFQPMTITVSVFDMRHIAHRHCAPTRT